MQETREQVKTLGLICANHNRPLILSLWVSCINRLRRETETYIPAVVVSGSEDKRICENGHIVHIEQENYPVSEKYNTAMSYMRSLGVSSVMITGSDNVMSTETYQRINTEVQKGYDLVGVQNIYFFGTAGTYKGDMVKFTGKSMLGVCKTISSSVLDKVDWRPWTKDKNWGLDGLVTLAIKPYVQTSKIVDDAVVFDIKSKQNLNRVDFWCKKIKEREDPQKLYEILSVEEREILNQIMR